MKEFIKMLVRTSRSKKYVAKTLEVSRITDAEDINLDADENVLVQRSERTKRKAREYFSVTLAI